MKIFPLFIIYAALFGIIKTDIKPFDTAPTPRKPKLRANTSIVVVRDEDSLTAMKSLQSNFKNFTKI